MGFSKTFKSFKKSVLRPTTKFLAPVLTNTRNMVLTSQNAATGVIRNTGESIESLQDTLTQPIFIYIVAGVGILAGLYILRSKA